MRTGAIVGAVGQALELATELLLRDQE